MAPSVDRKAKSKPVKKVAKPTKVSSSTVARKKVSKNNNKSTGKKSLPNTILKKSLLLQNPDAEIEKLSLPLMLSNTFVALPQVRAIGEREKEWKYYNSSEISQIIQDTTLGLKNIGVKKGDKVGLIAPSCMHWMIYDQAVMSCGAIVVAMFVNISTNNLLYQVKEANIKLVLTAGGPSLKKAEEAAHLLKKVVHDAPYKKTKKRSTKKNNVNTFKTSQLTTLHSIIETGKKVGKKDKNAYDSLLKKIKNSDPASIVYTSGTEGAPKGAIITHSAFLNQVKEANKRYKLFCERDVPVSYLPLAHIFERTIFYMYLSRGLAIHFCDQVENLGEIIRDVKPTIMTTVPRVLEKIEIRVHDAAINSKGAKGLLARAAINRAKKKPLDEAKTTIDNIYDLLVYRKIRNNLGGNFNYIISGGAPLDMNTYRFFTNLGITIYEGYGLTEACPVVASNYPGKNKPGTVGELYGNAQAKLGKNDELLVKSSSLMSGYYKKPKLTKKAIVGGWLHTGDKASIDSQNFITIKGRIKELYKTSYGKYVAPAPIEQKISQIPDVSHTLVIAEKKPFCSALIFIDDTVNKTEPTLHAEIAPFINVINAKLESWETIKQYCVIKKTLSVENEDLTPKMNIRREQLISTYSKEIADLYKTANVKGNAKKKTVTKKRASKSSKKK